MSLASFRTFKPAGPVAAAFLLDRETKVRAILGPVGGGKSVSCVFDLLSNATRMPVCLDGKIHFRVAIIGSTYGQMERNLFPTWKQWIPPDDNDSPWQEGEFTGGGGRYAQHKFTFDIVRDGQRVQVEFEAIFAAIGESNAEQFMRGFEPTAFWLYEVDLLAEDVLNQAMFRLGRFPAMHMLAPGTTFRSFIICDLNAPDVDSWFYRRFEEDRPKGHKLYRQPSGRSPQAENLANLQPGYYSEKIELFEGQRNGRYLIKRMIDAQYGPTLVGTQVFPEYSDELHLARGGIEVLPNVPIVAGFDQGVQWPACVIAQRAPSGQWRVLAECVPGRMNSHRFADRIKQMMAERAPGRVIEQAWADPAGFSGADREGGDLAWAESLSAALGVPIEMAPTNEIDPRLTSVSDELTYMIDGATPGLIIDGAWCPMLRKGFASHYVYKLDKKTNTEDPNAKPDKGLYSNPQDALQYLMLGVKGRYGAIVGDRNSDRRMRAGAPPPGFVVKQTFHPFRR